MTTPENNITMSEDETLKLLTAAVAQGDRFMVRIFRRKGGGMGEIFASFANTQLEQISQPEPWVARLGGGGEYQMQVAHMDKTQARIGGLLKFKIPGETRPLNIAAVNGQDWEGPTAVVYPPPRDPAAQQAANPLAPPGPGARQWGWADPNTGSGFAMTQQAPGVPADTLFLREQAAADRLAQKEREIAKREADLLKQITEREEAIRRSELEQRMRAESERSRAEADTRSRALEEKINRLTEAATRPVAPSGPNLAETITAISAALAPLVTTVMNSAAEARREQQKQAHEMAVQNQALLTSMLNKPAATMPPEVTMLFEMQKNQSSGNAEMMTRIVDAMGAVSKTSVAMIEAVADLGGGGEGESPALLMVREAVKAVTMLASGAKDGAKKQIQSQNQATQRTQPPQQPAQAQPQQGQGLPNGGGQTNGAGNTPGSQATPTYAPAGAVATGPQQQVSAEPVPANGLAEPTRNSVEELERLIRNRYEPIGNVAAFFVASIKTVEMKAALNEFEGDINELMADRLGDWIEESTQNQDYITRLAEAVDVAGTAAGIFKPEDQEDAQPVAT